MKSFFSHFFLLALFGLSTAFSEGGTFRLLPEADNYLDADSPNQCLRAEGAPKTKSYLRFNLKVVTGHINAATLRLKAQNFEPQEGRTLHFYALLNEADSRGWDERTLKSSNAPGNDATGNGFDANSTVDLGTLALPSAKSGDIISFSSPQLVNFLSSNTSSDITLMVANDSNVQANTTFDSTRNWNPAGQPTLELTTDSPDAFDEAFDKTITLKSTPQQTFEAFGCAFGAGSNFNQLDDAQRKVVSKFLFTDARIKDVRLWWFFPDTRPKDGGPNLSEIKNDYIDGPWLRYAMEAGVKNFHLSIGGNPPIPKWMLTDHPVAEAANQPVLKEDEVENYGVLLGQLVEGFDNFGLKLYSIGVANECINILPSQWPRVVKALRAELDRHHLEAVKIMGPEWPSNDNYAEARGLAIKKDPQAWAAFGAFCTHSYGMPCTRRFYDQFCRNTGKPYWVNESEGSTAAETAAHMINDINQGVSLWMYHEGVTGSREDWANLVGYTRFRKADDPDFMQVTQRYFYYRQITDTIEPGCVIHPAWSNAEQNIDFKYAPATLLACGGKNPDGKWVGILLSQSTTPGKAQLFIPDLAQQASTWMHVWRSGPGQNEERMPSVHLQHGHAMIEMKPNELVTLREDPAATAWYLGENLPAAPEAELPLLSGGVAVPLAGDAVHHIKITVSGPASGARAQVVDDPTGQVIDERAIPSGDQRRSLTWNAQGHVVVRLVNVGTTNVAITEAAAGDAQTGSFAKFLKSDATTRGNWVGTYGKSFAWVPTPAPFSSQDNLGPGGDAQYEQGLMDGTHIKLINAFTGFPPSPAAGQPAPPLPDDALLSSSDPHSSRTASCWYSFNGFGVNCEFPDAKPRQVALYIHASPPTDPKVSPGLQHLSLVDLNSGIELDSRDIKQGDPGQYLVWQVSGRVSFRLSAAPGGPILQGIFIDP